MFLWSSGSGGSGVGHGAQRVCRADVFGVQKETGEYFLAAVVQVPLFVFWGRCFVCFCLGFWSVSEAAGELVPRYLLMSTLLKTNSPSVCNSQLLAVPPQYHQVVSWGGSSLLNMFWNRNNNPRHNTLSKQNKCLGPQSLGQQFG